MCLHPPEPSKHHARCTCLCHDHVCQCQHALVATVAITSIASIMDAIHATEQLLNPEPYHTSQLSGRRWVEELKDGHPDCMTDNIGVQPAVFFQSLSKSWSWRMDYCQVDGLIHQRCLLFFLYQVVTNSAIWKTAERFQRSNETISKWVWPVWASSHPKLTFFQVLQVGVLNAVILNGFRSA